MIEGLRKSKLGLKVIEPEGGHFVLVDIVDAIKKIPISYFFDENTPEYVDLNNKYLNSFEEWKTLKPKYKPDEAVCNYLTAVYGITPIPCNPMFVEDQLEDQNDACRFVRFAICKKDEDIERLH